MKISTLKLLQKDLMRDFFSRKKLFDKRKEKGYTYEIEYIPVIVERDNLGNVGEISFPATTLIYQNENLEKER
ncbi:hypothetical protein [Clostridium perfringens]|jgi:hypothetical protein|uniref:Uncharacterized protein n=1 Tax=Clostridium perfringens TaxID=1502 RepID=A0AAW4IY36_CLOPF|nr:hypothetical protein [Clostridium perfringens]MBO3356118.1 hypothetical protein [Clostridium perfringens]MBO3359541.1 hypothetical protein [Clostridium perfringens]